MARNIDHANNAGPAASKAQQPSTYPAPNKAPFPARQAAAQPQHGIISQGGNVHRELGTPDHIKCNN